MGTGSVTHISTQLHWKKKKKKKRIDFFFLVLPFWVPVIEEERKPKEIRRIIAERKHRRLEKKGNWKTQKKQGKDKVCVFHFNFILRSW